MRMYVRGFAGLSIAIALSLSPVLRAPAVAASSTTPTVRVSPNRGLTDGQNVTLAGSGWTPGARVALWVCPGRIVSSLPTNAAEAEFLSFSGCAGVSRSGAGAQFSVSANLTRVQTYTSGCSSVCDTAVFTCGPVLGDCLVLATAPGSSGLELAIAPISFTTAHPPTLAVTPNGGLADGQTVTVSATGFAPFESTAVMECESPWLPTASARRPRCTPPLAYLTAGSSGAATATFRVRRLLGPPGTNRPLDCATVEDGCLIQQTTVLSLRVPVHFNPATPIVRPKLTVTPRDGLVEGQTVTIRGTDFAAGSVTVKECKAGTAAIANTGTNALPLLFEVCSAVGTFVATDQSGNFETTFALSKHPPNFNHVPIDCTKGGGCVIDAGSFPDGRFNSGFVDAPITFGTPTKAADCRHGGWRKVVDEHGRPFRNAGQCLGWLEDRAP
jgi:hypothetical protein